MAVRLASNQWTPLIHRPLCLSGPIFPGAEISFSHPRKVVPPAQRDAVLAKGTARSCRAVGQEVHVLPRRPELLHVRGGDRGQPHIVAAVADGKGSTCTKRCEYTKYSCEYTLD
jgi:hypothetical protein